MAAGLLLGAMALQGALGYGQARQQARLDNILGEHQQNIQRINNAEARRAGDLKQGNITINQHRTMERYINADANIDTAKMRARSAAIVSAAAAGTAGLSVDDTIRDIERNAAQAEANEMDTLMNTINDLERSRAGVEAEVRARKTNNIFLPTPQPSWAQHALGTGLDMATATEGSLWSL